MHRIRDWDKLYENAESRKIEQCRWTPIPNKQDGLGYRKIMERQDGASIYGAWVALVLACGKQKGRKYDKVESCWTGNPRLGILSDDGTETGEPLTANDLHLITGIPKKIMAKAIDILVQDIKWLEVVNNEGATISSGEVRVEQHRIEGNGSIKKRASEHAQVFENEFWPNYPAVGSPPVRTGKKPAKAKFLIACKTVDPHKILTGLERSKKTWDDPQYIPMAVTWLNQGRWDDEEYTPPAERSMQEVYDAEERVAAKHRRSNT